MKTSITRINRNATISLLDWPGLGESTISRPKRLKSVKVPELRIVPKIAHNDLLKYAIAANTFTGFWETIVYAAIALGAAGALVLAFGI